MRRLKVTHYLQDPSHCAIASCATLTNFFNKEIDYEYTKKIAYKLFPEHIKTEGLESGEMCWLLNTLGFYKVTLVSSYMGCFDYSWKHYKRKRLIETLGESAKKKKDKNERYTTRAAYKWLKRKSYDNNIIIDYNFGKHIRAHLNRNKPAIISFNWTMFFGFSKDGEKENTLDPINGADTDHAVVVYRYDKNGVWICDSHHEYYKYKRKKYRKGFYKIGWENLMTVIGQGDVILAEGYCF